MARRTWIVAAATAFSVWGSAIAAKDARAFCGFYVSGADAPLTNNATQVVLMREGIRTVLSMQNNYQGPPQNFAMVIPVPVVLKEENVKTLPRDVFDHVDRLTAPRLVESWEQDPCPPPWHHSGPPGSRGRLSAGSPAVAAMEGVAAAVKVEAQFSVGEYDIVVLSATDSSALDTWLRQNNYKIPTGAEPYLRPYVQMGMKFFVAKVDVSKVHFERFGNGPEQALLSPLRFHYDTDVFALPIRLGLINSGGTQDLVATILAPGQRYEVANYENVAIPTNIDVTDATRNDFSSFYATLFDDTVRKHPRSVVTEYSWSAGSCDPCPTPPLSTADLMTFGADVLPSGATLTLVQGGAPGRPWARPQTANFVITRLHARYSKDALGDDLVFRTAPPIVGGREFMQPNQKLEQGVRPGGTNNFQARYVIRHPWTGPIACSAPERGVWGAPPGQPPGVQGGPAVKPASRVGLVQRLSGMTLAAFVRGPMAAETVLPSGNGAPPRPAAPSTSDGADAALLDVDSGVRAVADVSVAAPLPQMPPPTPRGGCAGCSMMPQGATQTTGRGGVGAALVAGLFLVTRVRRPRRTRQ